MADAGEFARLMEPVCHRLFGQPSQKVSLTEWRYGNHGSLKISLDSGTWKDFDSGDGGGVLDLVMRKLGLPDQASAAEWLEREGLLQPRPRAMNSSEIVVYRYCDLDGTLLFEVVRRYQNGERKFSQRAPDPEHPGDWRRDEKGRVTVKGVKQVPYRLPELAQAIAESQTIFWVEGEKDADRLWNLGLAATSNAMGASNHKWLPQLAGFFADADVVIIPDYDLAGKAHADRIAKMLSDTAKRIRLLDWEIVWPEIRVKDDVSDWLDAGGGSAEALRAIAERLPTWTHPKARAKIIQFPAGLRPPWFERLEANKNGRPLTDLRNVMIVLQSDSRLVDCLAFNEMLQMPMIMQELPLAPGCGERSAIPRQVSEDDIGCLQHWLQYQQVRSVAFDTVRQAVDLRAYDRRFHPLRDWLDSLEPEPENEFDCWLSTYFGCEANDYHTKIGKMFLIAMVARIYQPGCQADYMLVLEGPQGEVKSQACRAIASDEYFSDNLPEVGGDAVRLSMALRGKWLIEISELSSFSKADTALLKSFITRQVEIFIPKFGRVERKEPRQCLFVGTTNDDAYLKDETGGRRFWPAKCGKTINLDGLRNAREQLFAHAVARYKRNEKWWPEREFEKTIIAPQQAARLHQDAWLPVIKDWLLYPTKLASPDPKLRNDPTNQTPIHPPFTLMEIAEHALHFDMPRFGLTEQRRLGAVLRLCGWIRTHKDVGNVWEKAPIKAEP